MYELSVRISRFQELSRTASNNNQYQEYIYNGRNIITDSDFQAKNAIKWGLKVF